MKFTVSSIISFALLACAGIEAKLTEAEKDSLLSLHKKARAALNSPNMQAISWDSSLAEKAQAYSAECKGMVHSGDGPENLAGSTTGSVERMFQSWWDEKSLFDQSGYRSNFKSATYGGEDIGHYSQIVWAENTRVGCGLTYCENYKAKYLLVCRYKSGNMIGDQVYALGSSSSTKKTESAKKTESPKTTESKKTTVKTSNKATATKTKPATTTKDASKSTTAPNKGNNVTPPVANNTLTNDKSKTGNAQTPITPGKGDKGDKGDNKEKGKDKTNGKDDEVVEEVGPSTYSDGNGTYVTGATITGCTVAGAAAAFIFLKKNPKQYKQLSENMKTIKRGISRKATSVRKGASVVTRKLSTKIPNHLQKSSSSNSSSNYTINNMPDYNIKELPNINYRYEFTQSFDEY